MPEEGFLNPKELVARFGVREEMNIADFGSGSGEIAVLLAQVVGEKGAVSALDVLPSALEAVQARARSAGLKNLIPIRANLEAPGGSMLGDNTQDMVLMANILWQSEKKKEIIDEAARILKHGGIATAVEWENGSIAGPPSNMRIGSDELSNLMASSGLKFVETFPAGGFHYGLIAKKP